MQKFLITILLSSLLAFAFGMYLPWWSVALATFLVSALIAQKPLAAFLSGFIGLFVLWLFLTISINSANGGVLAPKISQIMGLGESGTMLMLITSVVGATVGGLGALTASLFIRMLPHRPGRRFL